MSKYILIKLKDENNKFDISDIALKFETENLNDMLETYERFLQACGYVFEGNLDITLDPAE